MNMTSRILPFLVFAFAVTGAFADSYISSYQGNRLYSWDGQSKARLNVKLLALDDADPQPIRNIKSMTKKVAQ
jgi:hypothetical protein